MENKRKLVLNQETMRNLTATGQPNTKTNPVNCSIPNICPTCSANNNNRG